MPSVTNRFDKFLNHTCDSGNNNKYFEVATIIRINALVQSGRLYITLCELYENSGAVTDAQKTGVRYGVNTAKATGIIISTGRRGVYEVR